MEIGCGARSQEPEAVAAREAQQREREELAQRVKLERWKAAYEQAIKDLPDKYHAEEILADPERVEEPVYEMILTMADENFCRRLGNECAEAGGALITGSIAVGVGTIGGLTNLKEGDESAKLVKAAAERQLARGWDVLMDEHLSEEQKKLYAKHLKDGKIYEARGLLGHALHNAVAADLRKNVRMPDGSERFSYNASKGPDFTDKMTRVKVELTTYRGFMGHWLKGGAYTFARYVLYRGPGTMPPGSIRGGFMGPRGGR